jgi:CRP-like cAMP-binding protein
MSTSRIAQTLAEMKLFSGLNPKELDLLAMVMAEKVVSRGDVICVEGEPGSCCYFIAQGVVEVRVRAGQHEDRLLATLREGQLFGHLSLVDVGPRTATCIAGTTSRLFVLERDDFETLFNSGTRFAFKFQDMIARAAAQQLRIANDRLSLVLSQKQPIAERDAMSDLRDLLARTDSNMKIEVVYGDAQQGPQKRR